jgi:hypothetical protein
MKKLLFLILILTACQKEDKRCTDYTTPPPKPNVNITLMKPGIIQYCYYIGEDSIEIYTYASDEDCNWYLDHYGSGKWMRK